MNTLHMTNRGALGLFGVLLVGCGSDLGGISEAGTTMDDIANAPQWTELGDGAGVEYEADFRVCGKRVQQTAEGNVTKPEVYSFARMNAQVAADARLRAKLTELGIAQVDSCKTARAVAKVRGDLLLSPTADSQPAEPVAAEVIAPEQSETEAELAAGDDARVDKIGSGVAVGHKPTVMIAFWSGAGFTECGWCSGSLISENEILTAAHCIAADNRRPISVKAYNGTCLHGDCGDAANPGMCNPANRPPNTTGTTYKYPHYSGTGDWAEDIGIVVMDNNHPAPGNDPDSSWIRIAREHYRLGERYWLRGWGASSESGAGAGVLRRSSTEVANESASEHRMLQHTVVHGQGTICSGDSGGPAITTRYPPIPEAVVGVASGIRGEAPLAACPRAGETFFHAQTWPKKDWIEEKVGGCRDYEEGGLQYIRCW